MVNFINILPDNAEHSKLLNSFYQTIYLRAFNNEDEREELDNIYKYLLAEKQENYQYNIILMLDGSDILGGAIFDYFIDIDTCIIEFIAISEENRKKHFGTLLYEQILNLINPKYIFCETEKPTEKSYGSLFFWDKLGFKYIDFNYIQPALSDWKRSVTSLYLIVNNIPDKELIKNVLYKYMKYCMGILNPELNQEYIKMTKELDNNDKIVLNDLI